MVNVLSVGWSPADPGLADWYVDNSPLARWLSRFGHEVPAPRAHGVFATRHPDDLRALLGRPAPSGRVPLYRCARCGDPDCGVLAVRVTRDENAVQATVTWTDFAWEADGDPERFAAPTITFDLARYEAVFRHLPHRRTA
ncbi:hypothetical protein GCM10022243_42440 [Saccharothrix violaceirubra]|uniref:Uncharacterized protein n=1 Tax=Saccharothrix violaceirubra TaxID=413306 RepID=A0A7W7T3T2_9PSEU|nr:hypothetical protein [Saccharothrix violaceirubra]MBB4965532.1 hypothetical protein [Saccharothrix violaceirubra]